MRREPLEEAGRTGNRRSLNFVVDDVNVAFIIRAVVRNQLLASNRGCAGPRERVDGLSESALSKRSFVRIVCSDRAGGSAL